MTKTHTAAAALIGFVGLVHVASHAREQNAQAFRRRVDVVQDGRAHRVRVRFQVQ